VVYAHAAACGKREAREADRAPGEERVLRALRSLPAVAPVPWDTLRTVPIMDHGLDSMDVGVLVDALACPDLTAPRVYELSTFCNLARFLDVRASTHFRVSGYAIARARPEARSMPVRRFADGTLLRRCAASAADEWWRVAWRDAEEEGREEEGWVAEDVRRIAPVVV
jgi:hypothetical protein